MSSVSFQQGNRRKGKSISRQEEQQQQQQQQEEEGERVFSLSEADIEYIYDRTHYSVKDIKDWHRGFARDCPSGRLCRQRVTEVYDELFPHGSNNKWLVDTIFRIFDQDDNGYLDFKVGAIMCCFQIHFRAAGVPGCDRHERQRDGGGEAELGLQDL